MNDTYIVTREDGRTVLRHYGVLGMKWGVRRDRGTSQHARKKQAREVGRITEASRKLGTRLDKVTAKSASRAGRGADTTKLAAKQAKLTAAKGRLDALGRQKASSLTASELEKGAYQARRNKRLRKAAINGLTAGAAAGAGTLGILGGPAGAGLGAVLGGGLGAVGNVLGTVKVSHRRKRDRRQSYMD